MKRFNVDMILSSCVLLMALLDTRHCLVAAPTTEQVEVTSPQKSRDKENSSALSVQQIMQRLGMMETENQRHTAKLSEIAQSLTRVELQRQEMISVVDRAESRMSQRLDDIKGDIHKVMALQEILREDVEKTQQDQLFAKVWLEEQIRHMSEERAKEKPLVVSEQYPTYGAPDLSANFQVLQTTLNNLRKQVFSMQSTLAGLQFNITQIRNATETLRQKADQTVTKQYLMVNLREMLESTMQPMVYCSSTASSPASQAEELLRDCSEVLEAGHNESGIYRIKPMYTNHLLFVYCDMETDGGGWTVFQRRQDGSVDFLREWRDYKYGFGNIVGEHWLGNEYLHLITQQNLYELRIELKDFEEGETYAQYDAFVIGDEKQRYMIKVLGHVSGDAGDGMSYHASMRFSTIDSDNDRWMGGHCAKSHTGGWWYNQCEASNLNGKYLSGLTTEEYKGVYWHDWHGAHYSLRFTEMKIRPRNRGHLWMEKATEMLTADGENNAGNKSRE